MRRHSRTKKPMRFLVAVALTALIAGPSVAADRDAERIVTRHVASIVPPDGAGGIAVALRIGACARCQRAADLPAGKHLRVTFAGGSLKPLFDGWFFGFSRNPNYRSRPG